MPSGGDSNVGEVLGKAGQMVKSILSPGQGFEFNSMYNGQLLGRIKPRRDLIPLVSEKEHTCLESVLGGLGEQDWRLAASGEALGAGGGSDLDCEEERGVSDTSLHSSLV